MDAYFADVSPDWAAQELECIRHWIEYHTTSDPYTSPSFHEMAWVARWAEYPDKLKIITSVLVSRLSLASPACYKALLLAQWLPPSALIPLLDPLSKLATRTNPAPPPKDAPDEYGTWPNAFFHSLATFLVGAATKEKEAQAEKEAKERWALWAGLYGQSGTGWVPLDKARDMEGWGWYAMMWVGVDDWWCLPG